MFQNDKENNNTNVSATYTKTTYSVVGMSGIFYLAVIFTNGVNMLRKRKKVKNYHEFYVRLQNLLEVRYSPWGDLSDKERLEGNIAAKQTLYSVYNELTNVLPDVRYKSGRRHTSYFFQLFLIKRALKQGEYMIVVWELGSLIHSEPFLQPRVYYNVIRILEQCLGVEGGSFKMRRFFHRCLMHNKS